MLSYRSIYTTLLLPIKQENTLLLLCFSRGKLAQRKPFIRGKVEYYFKNANDFMWRPRRIFWEEKGKWKPSAPKNTIQKIFTKSRYLLLSTTLSNKETEGIKRFCKDFMINTPIKETILCPFCVIHDRITVLSPKSRYKVYNRKVCKVCAIQELERELSAKKINLLASPGFKKYAVSLLGRLHDIQKVLAVFSSDQASLGDLTLIRKVGKLSEDKLKPFVKSVSEFNLPPFLLKSLQIRKIDTFLPIQVQAIQKGLFENTDQLIIANTSAGKTLIGELAGISYVLRGKKFIFTVPLVALANTKFEEFKRLYGSRFKIGLRTGRSRIFSSIKEKKAFYRFRYSVKDSDIIVATYEGLDLLIKGGEVEFNEISCIVVDEIQTIADAERGATLDCLLAKIRSHAQDTQILALSATVGNPSEFAKDLSLTLVTFDQRPIPLEQHLLISRSENEKLRQIVRLTKNEYQITSSAGFRGQTIVFTNSRRKTGEITDYLRHAGIHNARAYHSGLSYPLRRRIENEFSTGECSVVVSTYALGAGVDFPASQVIFESLKMGKEILDPNSFAQMVGRAGRLGKHDCGRSILLCMGEVISAADSRTEIEIAFNLMNADLLPIEPNHDENSCGEQILSICSTRKHVLPKFAKKIYQRMIGTINYDFMSVTNKLIQNSLLQIVVKNNQRYLELTPLGRAATMSFFSPEKVLHISSLLKQKKHFLSISLEMNPPQNIYLSKKLHSYLEKTYHMRFSTRLINSPVLDVMNASLKGKEATELNKWCLKVFAKWTQHFFSCSCPENPYCNHGQENIGRYIVNQRLKGKNTNQLSAKLSQFDLLVYPGDILSFLNGLIHELEGIQRVAEAIGKPKISKLISVLVDKIETPYPLINSQ
ncbi:MAG: DEAD/DEAH box helicase [Candidatus Heimdallarchaeota archaeon]|nr:MAG: DEAD/DEAH box helicase [Candidatus Heimdallarchaeota archaeon]